MGSGKTEGALAGRFGRSGVVWALPTKATTNAMYARVRDFYTNALKVGRSQESTMPRDAQAEEPPKSRKAQAEDPFSSVSEPKEAKSQRRQRAQAKPLPGYSSATRTTG